MVGGQVLLVVVQSYVYPSWQRVFACLAAIVVLSVILERQVRRRANRVNQYSL